MTDEKAFKHETGCGEDFLHSPEMVALLRSRHFVNPARMDHRKVRR